MHTLIKKILESYLFEKKIVQSKDIDTGEPLLQEKLPIFITAYDGETVVGSAGKIYPTQEKAIEELIENTILMTKDERYTTYMENPEKARILRYRVDVFRDSDRRLLHHPDDLNTATEGMIVLCQKQEKVGIILPRMLSSSLSGEEVYHHVIQKIHLDTKHLGKGDVILYAVKTETFE